MSMKRMTTFQGGNLQARSVYNGRPFRNTIARISRPPRVSASSAAAPTRTELVLHVDQTSISFPLKLEAGKALDSALQELLQTFAAKQKAERPQRWKSMEYRYKGEAGQAELEFLEVFCNPNSASSAFNAKALITLRTQDGIKVTTEGRLSALKEDLDMFLAQNS